MLRIFFGTVTLAATVRLATPILIASVGSCFSHKIGTFNIAYECFMLFGAFFAAYGSWLTGSPAVGALCATLSGVVLAAVFGIFVFHLNANPMIVSIALNLGAWAVTTLLLTVIWGVRGTFISPDIISFKPLNLPMPGSLAYLGEIFGNHIILVYMAYVMVFAAAVLMYRTSFGLRIRGIGINSIAAETAGINVLRYKWAALIIMGASVGFSGAYLSLSGLNSFSENMTAGRGFIAFASTLVGDGNPLICGAIAVIFVYADALTLTLTSLGYPTQLTKMLPYLAVLLVLMVGGIRNIKNQSTI